MYCNILSNFAITKIKLKCDLIGILLSTEKEIELDIIFGSN